jgi:chromosome segregation ATPase
MNAMAQTNYDQSVAIQGYTNSLGIMDRQIAQMDARITELKETIRTNNTVWVATREENTRLLVQIEQYSNAVGALQAQIKLANDSIHRQNEVIKNLVTERDEFVNRLNESIKERNEVVTKFNELVKRVEEMQEAQSKKK